MHSLILKRYLAHNSGQAVHALQLHPQAKHRHCYHNSTFGSIHYLYSAAYHSQQGSTKPHLLHHRHRHYYSCSIAPVSVLRKVSASSCCLETSPVVGEAAVSWCTPAIFTSTKTSSPLLFPHLRRRGATPHTTFPLVSPTSQVFFSSLHSFFTTSFSPIRISGHILCSFSQVSHPHHHLSSCTGTDILASFGVTTSPAHRKSLTFTTR